MASGISGIQKYLASITENEALRDQLMRDLSRTQDQVDDSKRSSLAHNKAAEDDLVQANISDAKSKKAGEDAVNVDEERKKANQATLDKRDCDIACAKEALNEKIHLQKFVDSSGMCGMGMGMGNTYSESGAIDLTAQELYAMKDVLLDIGDSQETFDSNFESVASALNARFEKDGTGSHASVGSENGTSYIEISRADGSNVKIYDANGNGALDMKDYDFCQAISKACEIISNMETQICKIETEACNEITNRNKQADAEIANLRSQEAQFADEADAYRRSAQDHYNKAASFDDEVARGNITLISINDKIDEANKDIAKDQKALDEAEKEMKADKEKAEAEAAQAKEDAQAEIDQAQADLEAAEEQQQEEADEALAEAQADLEAAQDALEDAQADLADAQEDAATTEAQQAATGSSTDPEGTVADVPGETTSEPTIIVDTGEAGLSSDSEGEGADDSQIAVSEPIEIEGEDIGETVAEVPETVVPSVSPSDVSDSSEIVKEFEDEVEAV